MGARWTMDAPNAPDPTHMLRREDRVTMYRAEVGPNRWLGTPAHPNAPHTPFLVRALPVADGATPSPSGARDPRTAVPGCGGRERLSSDSWSTRWPRWARACAPSAVACWSANALNGTERHDAPGMDPFAPVVRRPERGPDRTDHQVGMEGQVGRPGPNQARPADSRSGGGGAVRRKTVCREPWWSRGRIGAATPFQGKQGAR